MVSHDVRSIEGYQAMLAHNSLKKMLAEKRALEETNIERRKVVQQERTKSTKAMRRSLDDVQRKKTIDEIRQANQESLINVIA